MIDAVIEKDNWRKWNKPSMVYIAINKLNEYHEYAFYEKEEKSLLRLNILLSYVSLQWSAVANEETKDTWQTQNQGVVALASSKGRILG